MARGVRLYCVVLLPGYSKGCQMDDNTGCRKTPSLRVQSAPELEDAGMYIYIYLVFNFHVRNLFVWWNLFFLQLTLDIIIY